MKYRFPLALLLSVILTFLAVSTCFANSILELDADGNISTSRNDDPGDSPEDAADSAEEAFEGSSDQEFDGSSAEEFAGSSEGEDPMSGSSQATEYKTEYGYPYSVMETDTPFSTNHLCMILIPGSIDQGIFLEQTEWTFFAGMGGIDIVVLSFDWQEEESATQYFESVYQEVLNRAEEELMIYLVGYEEGADFAAWEAATNTARYSGLVTLGGSGISQEQLDELNDIKDKEALSVWIINSDKAAINKNLKYWRTANSITGSSQRAYQMRFADELYLPPTSTAGKITSDSNRMGILVFSRESEYYDASVTGNITRNFISQVEPNRVSFRDGITGGEIISISDRHFTYNRMQLDGQQRDYWIYVPDTALATEEPCSLIFVLHGNMGTGEDMIFQSQWHEIAAENNCIILYPSSLYKIGSQHYWQIIPEETDYIRALLETVCSLYRVDRSRVYVTGFSNGSGMAQNLAIRCSDIFAAAVMSAPAYYESDIYGPVSEIHEVATFYSYGTTDEYLLANDETAEIYDLAALRKLQYWRMMYGFEQGSYHLNEVGKFTLYIYQSLNYIPVSIWMKVDGKKHCYASDEVLAYYEFMRHYTKGENGELYYNGIEVISNVTNGTTWDYYSEDPANQELLQKY